MRMVVDATKAYLYKSYCNKLNFIAASPTKSLSQFVMRLQRGASDAKGMTFVRRIDSISICSANA